MVSPVTFAVAFALKGHVTHNSHEAQPSSCTERDDFAGMWKRIFKFTAGFCCEIRKVLMGG